MTAFCVRLTLIAATFVAVWLPSTVRAQTGLDASHFVWLPALDAGGAVLQTPHAGAFIYAAIEPSDGRVAQRFVIGRAPRSDFVLFSADEEQALWTLRDRQRFPKAYLPPRPMRALPPPGAAPRAAIDWPKVVVADGRTCVPTGDFADAHDWRSHLVCWVRATREVRHD